MYHILSVLEPQPSNHDQPIDTIFFYLRYMMFFPCDNLDSCVIGFVACMIDS